MPKDAHVPSKGSAGSRSSCVAEDDDPGKSPSDDAVEALLAMGKPTKRKQTTTGKYKRLPRKDMLIADMLAHKSAPLTAPLLSADAPSVHVII